MSDYFAIKEMMTRHHLVADLTEGAYRALKAGVDIETLTAKPIRTCSNWPPTGAYPKPKSMRWCTVSLNWKVLGGLFEAPYVDAKAADKLTAMPEAVALAHEAGRLNRLPCPGGQRRPATGRQKRSRAAAARHPCQGYADRRLFRCAAPCRLDL